MNNVGNVAKKKRGLNESDKVEGNIGETIFYHEKNGDNEGRVKRGKVVSGEEVGKLEYIELLEKVETIVDGEILNDANSDFPEDIRRIFRWREGIKVWRGGLEKWEFDGGVEGCRERTVGLLKGFKEVYLKMVGNEEKKKVVNETFVSWIMLMRELVRMEIIGWEGMGLLNGAIWWKRN